MMRRFRKAMLLTMLVAVPARADAGWVSEWTNIATKPNGDRMEPQQSSMAIATGRVRLAQPEAITLVDYNTGTFMVLNPVKLVFWSGTVDDYARAGARSRSNALRQRLAKASDKPVAPEGDIKLPKVDPAKLPPISITKSGVTEKIAGYDTVKYLVQVDGDLFQELWVAPALDVSADLDVDRYLAHQRTMGAGMSGKAAGQYNALYLSDDYRTLIAKAFVLKMITHHLAGSFERTATSVRQADVAASEFAVPEQYRKVRLADVLPAPPAKDQSAPSTGAAAVRPSR